MTEEDKKDLETVSLGSVEIEPKLLSILPEDICRKYSLIPISRSGAILTVAMIDPTNVFAIDDVRFTTGFKIKPVFSSKEDITKALDKHFKKQISPESHNNNGIIDEELFEEAPVIKLVNIILSDAVKKNASHIHLEPLKNTVRVRYRVDGILLDAMNVPLKMKSALNSRMKIMSKLDISERRLPQEGRLNLKIKENTFDTVVATFPTAHGERIVIELLPSTNEPRDIEELGISSYDLNKFNKAIRQPSGLVLISGPRGSGKKTTIYAALNELNTNEVNILTVENPITVDLEGVGQTQIMETIGYSYVSALRSMMGQDPDIIMIQEINDLETAEKVIQVTLEGYLVLSSMDVGDSVAALLKLLELGISPSMINASINLVLSQRLVRKICEDCLVESSLTEDNFVSIKEIDPLQKTGEWSQKDKIYIGEGCDQCGKSGYRGRIPITETLILTPMTKKALLNKVSQHELRKIAIDEGMTSMAQDALKKVKLGETTMDECLRIFSLFL